MPSLEILRKLILYIILRTPGIRKTWLIFVQVGILWTIWNNLNWIEPEIIYVKNYNCKTDATTYDEYYPLLNDLLTRQPEKGSWAGCVRGENRGFDAT